MQLQGRLRHDLTTNLSSFIPSNLEVRLRLIQSLNAFRLHALEEKNYKLTILDSTFKVCFIKLTPEEIVRQSLLFDKGPAEFHYDQTEIRTFQLAKNSYSTQLENIFPGTLPSRLLIGLIPSAAYSGQITKNNFQLKHYNVNNISVTIDGQDYPGPPLRPSFRTSDYVEAYLRLVKDGGENLGITLEDFSNGYTLFAFDLEYKTPPGIRAVPLYGNLRISISFEAALPEGVSLIILSTKKSSFFIDKVRNVLL